MSLSSFCVVMNALRLNLLNVHDASKDRKPKNALPLSPEGTLLGGGEDKPEIQKGEFEMKKTLAIEGMMCNHCENTVKKALEALEGVTAAEVSHTAGTAVVTLSAPVADDALKSAVEAKDYKVLSIA